MPPTRNEERTEQRRLQTPMSQTTSFTLADTQGFLDEAAYHCKTRGSSLTPIRRKVLGLLLGEPGGMKAYDLLDRIKQVHSAATPPTVYRALDFLIEQGLAHKIARTNQFVACNQGCHDHASLFLVCPQCHQITELRDETALAALSKSLTAAGHTLISPEIEISALCRDCAQIRPGSAGT